VLRSIKTLLIIALGLTALSAFRGRAEETVSLVPAEIVGAVPCENVRVIDGDTIHCSIVCPFGLTIRDKTIRAANYDAWESSRARRTVNVTELEVVNGKQATAALRELIGSGILYARDTGRADAYGRLLATLFVRRGEDFIDVASWMRQGGHLRSPRTDN
jgi:endonuclease YncB( thermonuclease family)